MIEETKAANPGADQPAAGELGVDEVQPVERVLGVLHRPYMCTPQPVQAWRRIVAALSTMESFWRVLGHGELVVGYDRHHREERALGLPALGAAAGMVVSGLRPDRHLHRVLAHLQTRVPPGKSFAPGRIPPSTDG